MKPIQVPPVKEVPMIRILTIVAFVLSIIFYAWSLGHGPWTWTLFMLLGLLGLALGA